ncbi:MAG: helix-turn-helix transcriptional regulator [Ruminococcus sp.]
MKIRNELNTCLFVQKTNDIQRQPHHIKIQKYTDICNGNLPAVEQSLSHPESCLFPDNRELSKDAARNMMYHLVITASTVSTACIEHGMGQDEADTIADIYIRKADSCKDSDTIFMLYKEMLLDFTERMHEIKKQHVISLHVRKCIDYIYEHLGENLTVHSLAAYCGIHPSYLSRLFTAETGIHLKHFIKMAKIDTAQNLLRYSDLSYLDIAIALGFSSQSAFIDSFKTVTGTTPKKYREVFYQDNP